MQNRAERSISSGTGLRALLIQKDAKRGNCRCICSNSLRALLIQKDAKPHKIHIHVLQSLRALLIQKDAKLLHFVAYQ